jgi:hypothetical protein
VKNPELQWKINEEYTKRVIPVGPESFSEKRLNRDVRLNLKKSTL